MLFDKTCSHIYRKQPLKPCKIESKCITFLSSEKNKSITFYLHLFPRKNINSAALTVISIKKTKTPPI